MHSVTNSTPADHQVVSGAADAGCCGGGGARREVPHCNQVGWSTRTYIIQEFSGLHGYHSLNPKRT